MLSFDWNHGQKTEIKNNRKCFRKSFFYACSSAFLKADYGRESLMYANNNVKQLTLDITKKIILALTCSKKHSKDDH